MKIHIEFEIDATENRTLQGSVAKILYQSCNKIGYQYSKLIGFMKDIPDGSDKIVDPTNGSVIGTIRVDL